MRNRFDNQLAELNNELISMGALCENAIASAVKSLIDGDTKLAAAAIRIDHEIDRKEREIESMCLKLLLTQHPVATDLRTVSSALKMVTDLERIGNQSADIADIVRIAAFPDSAERQTIHDMAQAVIGMVSGSVDAFASGDCERAAEIIAEDDVVDAYFDRVKEQLITDMKHSGDFSRCGIDLLMIAKYFERIGDHATNIAEWVEFSVTGVHKSTEL